MIFNSRVFLRNAGFEVPLGRGILKPCYVRSIVTELVLDQLCSRNNNDEW